MQLTQYNDIPEGLLECRAEELADILPGPALLHLEGRRQPALFVSVLMHGNEDVGWEAVRALLMGYEQNGRTLPRSLSLFIGNVSAAREGLRHLPGQADYNRVWPGSELPHSAEHVLIGEVYETMHARGVFASIDLHNNTGMNPHYGCINVLRNEDLHLATLFSRTVVYFIRPVGVQSIAMGALCPAVTLECGKVGQQHGVDHAREYVEACLHLAELPDHPVAAHDLDLFHTVGIVKVPDHVDFGVGDAEHDLVFADDIDRLNFRELPAGTWFGTTRHADTLPLAVCSEQGEDVSERYFELQGRELRTRVPVMPSMLTLDARVIRQDCLCYLMERMKLDEIEF